MRLQRQLRGLLMISLATASAVFTQSCASSRRTAEDFGPSSPYPFSFTMYEVSDDESCADIVLTVDLQIPDAYTHTYEFPIRARLYVDTGKGTAIHIDSVGGISADNPFNGTGFNGSVNVFEITATSATVSADFSWTNSKHEKGELKQDLKIPYGKPLSVRLPDGSTIEISWRKPRSASREEPPEEDADPPHAVQNRS